MTGICVIFFKTHKVPKLIEFFCHHYKGAVSRVAGAGGKRQKMIPIYCFYSGIIERKHFDISVKAVKIRPTFYVITLIMLKHIVVLIIDFHFRESPGIDNRSHLLESA